MQLTNDTLLEVRGLKKYFPVTSGLFRKQIGNVKAVDGIDFSIKKGEVVGMVGESGSGKSTAGRVAIRLIEPTAGSITFEGQNVVTMDRHELIQMRQDIQMVFQDPYASLNPRKTISESIGEPLVYHRIVSTQEEKIARVYAVLEKVGLSKDIINRYPHEFSGGQQQRICIARAIIMNPKLIICDEVVSALDVSVQAQILNLFADLKNELGLSYLFIAHDLSVVRYLCDRVIVMYLGKIMEEASTKELFQNPKHPYTQALLSAIPVDHPRKRREIIALKGEIPSPLNPPTGCPFRTRCPHAQPICSSVPPRKQVPGTSHFYNCILD